MREDGDETIVMPMKFKRTVRTSLKVIGVSLLKKMRDRMSEIAGDEYAKVLAVPTGSNDNALNEQKTDDAPNTPRSASSASWFMVGSGLGARYKDEPEISKDVNERMRRAEDGATLPVRDAW